MINLKGTVKTKQKLSGGVKAVAGKLAVETETYLLVMEDGTEIPAVAVSDEVLFTATANDIRAGTVAASASGVVVGEKDIPAYHTTEGFAAVPAGGEGEIYLATGDRYNFTKLQAIICPFSTSIANSVAAEAVSIDGKVYAVGSTVVLSTVTIDHDAKSIKLGMTNNSDIPYIIRYITYKEEK